MDPGELTVYRGSTPVVDAHHDADSDQSPTRVIVGAVAEAAGVDPLDLPPLYKFVDTDSIDGLFDRQRGGHESAAIYSFRVERWDVFVSADGRIRVCDSTWPTDPEPVFESTTI